tara:strand:- start:772 stop:1005 length:234 start_codon:yes stop_codon:yes gene_type:complete
MNDRKNDLIRIRPEIKKINSNNKIKPEELFQNKTLRPILKFKNPIFIEIFIDYVKKNKDIFYELNNEKKIITLRIFF